MYYMCRCERNFFYEGNVNNALFKNDIENVILKTNIHSYNVTCFIKGPESRNTYIN